MTPEESDCALTRAVWAEEMLEERERRNALRWQAACAAMSGFIAQEGDKYLGIGNVVLMSVQYADELLAEFEKGER